MKGIYLASFEAYHENYNIVYQDINGKRDLGGSMLDIDLSQYDFIIATPPCNYWSRANYRRETSEYSQLTKHLLPCIIRKLIDLDKPFIIENVRNYELMNRNGLFDNSAFVYEIGRHTYWTNVPFNMSNIKQETNFKAVNSRVKGERGWFMKPDGTLTKSAGKIQKTSTKNRQGGFQVFEVIDYWLKVVKEMYF